MIRIGFRSIPRKWWVRIGFASLAPGIIFGIELTPAMPLWQRILVHFGLTGLLCAFLALSAQDGSCPSKAD